MNKRFNQDWIKIFGEGEGAFDCIMLDEIKHEYLHEVQEKCERINAPMSAALIKMVLNRKLGGE